MKISSVSVAAFLAFLFLLVMAGPIRAFHDQGSSNCDSCHLQHDSEDGLPAVPGVSSDSWLLKGETASDLCLSCHAGDYGAVFSFDPLTPGGEVGGGDFGFLLEENINDSESGFAPISGDAAGHNLDAPGHGLATDPRFIAAPGGSYLASDMSCTSCHDPHGNGNFRLLYGAQEVQGGKANFAFDAPDATGLDLAGQEDRFRHTAYLSGMSNWCANCHGRYHSGPSGSSFEHPTDRALGAVTSEWYNNYDGDDQPTSGSPATAYLAEVPFEDPSNSITSTAGPSPSSRILCLTCHRAHASSAVASGRWDFQVSVLADDGVASGSFPIPSPYAFQGQGGLCRKCHDAIPSLAESKAESPFPPLP